MLKKLLIIITLLFFAGLCFIAASEQYTIICNKNQKECHLLGENTLFKSSTAGNKVIVLNPYKVSCVKLNDNDNGYFLFNGLGKADQFNSINKYNTLSGCNIDRTAIQRYLLDDNQTNLIYKSPLNYLRYLFYLPCLLLGIILPLIVIFKSSDTEIVLDEEGLKKQQELTHKISDKMQQFANNFQENDNKISDVINNVASELNKFRIDINVEEDDEK